jgi:hypothetical protein
MLAGCATLSATSLPLLNGDCPEGFSVKGNNGNNGWIYHTNKSPYYNRVNPEWCFKNEEAANQFGYRKFKTRKSYGH